MAFNSNAEFTASLSLASDTVCDGIDEHYPLGEASGTRAGNRSSANDLSDVNTVTQTTGKIGDAAEFTRANGETLQAANSGVHDKGDEDFTIAFWGLLTTKPGNAQTFVSKFRAGSNRQYFVDFTPGAGERFRFLVDSNGTSGTTIVSANSFGAPTAGVLHFIVAWHDSVANTINIQINDGTVDSAAHSTGVFQGNALFSIGSYQDSGGSPTEFLNGVADEVTIYNRVLTADERSALYSAGSGTDLSTCKFFQASVGIDADFFPLLTQENALCDIAVDLSHYYRLEEASGTAFDVRGTAGDLTQGNTPGNASGKIGNARNFVRASSHAIGAPGNDLHYMDGTEDFTVTCWGSTDDLAAADQAFWGRFDNSSNIDRGPLLFFDASADTVRFVMSLNGTSNAVDLEPTLQLNVSQLYFFEITYVASTRLLTFRINRGTGVVFEDSATVGAGTWFKTTINFQIGDATSSGTLHLDGLVDELVFHDRVLTSAELDGLYNLDSGVNLNDLLLRKVATDFDAAANFTTTLTVPGFQADVTADADFTAVLSIPEVSLVSNFTADANFSMVADVDRELVSNFTADADFTMALPGVTRGLAVNFVAEANFQADPLQVFDAFQIGFQADVDFGQALNVTTGLVVASNFTADADFTMVLDVAFRELRFAFAADADFTMVAEVERGLLSPFEADADFTMNVDLAVQLLVSDLVVEPNFQMNVSFVFTLFKFDFFADADFLMPIFVADHNAFVADFLEVTALTDSVQIAGLSANIQPSVLDTQYQAEVAAGKTLLETLDPTVQVMAEPTGAAPAPFPVNTNHAVLVDFVGGGIDWFDNLYVLPVSVALGFIITDQSVPFEIYSSFKTATRSLDSTVNNVDAGFSFGGGFPLLPESIPPQSGFPFTVEIDSEGPPIIDGTIDFVFDIQTILVPFTGQRTVLFSVPPTLPIREQLKFSTTVLRKKTENEQRISKRFTPRQVLNYKFELQGFSRQCLDAIIFDGQARPFGVPIWFEPIQVTQAITQGDLVINVETTAFRDLRVGGLAVVMDQTQECDATLEVFDIAFITANTITSSTQMVRDHAANAIVYPVRIARMGQAIRGQKSPVNLQTTTVELRVVDNDSDLSDVSTFPSFSGKVLLDEPNMIGGGLSETWERRLIVIDNQTGTFEATADADVSRRSHTKLFLSQSHERLWRVRQLLHALRGRQISFYLPTFFDEFNLTAPVTTASDKLTFQNFGYSRFVQERNPRQIIRLVLNDGTTVIRTVLSSLELSLTEEEITVDAVWGLDATVDEINYVDYLAKVRMDSDTVRIIHKDTRGTAEISIAVKDVLE